MDIHAAHVLVVVALHHAEELPAVPFVERGVIGDKAEGAVSCNIK